MKKQGKIAVIGTGRLGTSLGNALACAGYGLAGLADSDIRAARRAKRIIGRGQPTLDSAAAAAAADIVFLTVPDDALARAVSRLCAGEFDGRGKTVFHTSGILPASRLSRLAARGAAVGSFHPAQSFPTPSTPPSHFRETVFGLEGDPAAVRTAKTLVRALGGRPVVLEAGQKALYHAACVLASNLLPPLIELAVQTMTAAGIPAAVAKKALLPLIEGTLRNVKVLDAHKALTGPLIRLDFETIERQLKALRRIPRAREAYRTVGLASLDLLKKRGAGAGSIKRLRALLEGK
ncbi:MAG: DUF2520 domain-containing protein [Candidatus Aminicenantes bacterium]|nr:DUF2520 domain-containing protein [Candidatus Aminicenantes bacterium]